MKKTLNKIKDGALIWFWFLLILWISNAWVDLWTVSNWAILTETIWNDMVTKLNETGNRVSWIFTDWSGKVWIWTNTPNYNLDIISTWNSNVLVWATTTWNVWLVLDASDWDWINSDYMLLSQTDDLDMHIYQPLWNVDLLLQEAWWNVWIWTLIPATKLDVNWKISATAFWLDIQYISTTWANSTQNMTSEASCPANYVVIWWGCDISISWAAQLLKSYPISNSWWRCTARHEYWTNQNVTAHAICVKTD